MNNKQNLSSQSPADSKLELYKSIGEWPPGSKYTTEEKVKALTLYFMCGSLNKTARQSGVPLATLHDWKTRSPWWDAYIEQCRIEKSAEYEACMHKIIEKAGEIALDRLKNGDEHITRDGQRLRKSISCRDATMVGAIWFDKLRILQNLPTRITADSNQQLGTLAAKLKELEQNLSKPAINVERVEND